MDLKLFIMLSIAAVCALPQPKDIPDEGISVMFWNLENFFDWKVDSLSSNDSDKEFSSYGARHWTRKKFLTKCNAVAKSIFWVSDSEGGLPDIISVAEVENAFVLRGLKEETLLRKTDYQIVHYDSPDPRGIDVALLYRSSRLTLLNSRPERVFSVNGGDTLVTRDILLSTFRLPAGDTVAVLVNHHPSKYGGESSSWKRRAALSKLRQVTDSLQSAGVRKIVATGDFNDTPEADAFRIITKAGEGSAPPLVDVNGTEEKGGEGTIRYQGLWERIDLFFLSRDLAAGEYSCKVLRIPFLMEWDNAYPGKKPRRTYVGPRYSGGVSDHCPVILKLGNKNAPER